MELPVELFVISFFRTEDGELNYYITSKFLCVVKGYIITKSNKLYNWQVNSMKNLIVWLICIFYKKYPCPGHNLEIHCEP